MLLAACRSRVSSSVAAYEPFIAAKLPDAPHVGYLCSSLATILNAAIRMCAELPYIVS